MIRLAFYTENYVIGGCERYLGDLIGGIDRHQYEIILFSNPNPAFVRYLSHRELGNIPHRVIPILPPVPRLIIRRATQIIQQKNRTDQSSRYNKTAQRYLKEIVNGIWRYVAAGPNLVSLIAAFRSQRIDILHINNGGYPAAETCRLAVLAASFSKIPACVMTVHGPATPFAWPHTLERALDEMVAKRVGKIITAAISTAHSLHEMRGMPYQIMQPIDLGINLVQSGTSSLACEARTQLGIPLRAIVVGIVGRFDWYKGHRYLLEAARILMDSGEGGNMYLLLVGDGDELPAMKWLAHTLGIADRAVFAGFYPDALAAMQACDIMTMLSVTNEGQGYVTIEAMAQARPVIASNVCGLGEVVVDGETGFLVPPADSNFLAAAIRELINSEQLRISMGRAARRRVEERFTLDRMIANTQSVYAELLSERSQG